MLFSIYSNWFDVNVTPITFFLSSLLNRLLTWANFAKYSSVPLGSLLSAPFVSTADAVF